MGVIILGLNGPGKLPTLPLFFCSGTYFCIRIFRTDYGHTEVAAHFGNGASLQIATALFLTLDFLDPREYCISTKDFVLNPEGKLKGLNTGVLWP